MGTVRTSNDDLVFASNDCRLYVALDGIGGRQGGGEASRIALEQLRSSVESMCETASGQPDQDLRAAVSTALSSATKAMLEVAAENPEFDKMGTVFALAYVVDATLLYTHVGDCRIYLVRRGKARQLTSDQTYVQLMVDVGVIEPDEVKDHPLRNIVLNAVGTRPADSDPVVQSAMLLPGDTILLTTDGVTDVLSEDNLTRILGENSESENASESIVHAALDAGSRDNASCVVVAIDRAEGAGNDEHDELHFELIKLHEMLNSVESVDDELRDDMAQIAADIQKALKQSEATELTKLSGRLDDRALAFEVSHPRLTAIVASITDMLARIGI